MISFKHAGPMLLCSMFAAVAVMADPAPAAKTPPAGGTPNTVQPKKAENKTGKVADNNKNVRDDKDPKKMEQRILHQLRLDSPEKFEAMIKLRKDNPAKYKEELERQMVEQQKKLDDFNRMVKDYRAKPDEALKTKIRAQLAESYDKQSRWKKTELDRSEERLKRQSEEYRKRIEQRNREIDSQVEKLTSQRAKQW